MDYFVKWFLIIFWGKSVQSLQTTTCGISLGILLLQNSSFGLGEDFQWSRPNLWGVFWHLGSLKEELGNFLHLLCVSSWIFWFYDLGQFYHRTFIEPCVRTCGRILITWTWSVEHFVAFRGQSTVIDDFLQFRVLAYDFFWWYGFRLIFMQNLYRTIGKDIGKNSIASAQSTKHFLSFRGH